MLRIPFEWFEFAFQCLSNGSNLHLNASNPWFKFAFESLSNGLNLHSYAFRMVRICIRMPFEWFVFGFECLSNGSNLHSNSWNPFNWFEFAFELLLNVSNLHLNASNPFRMASNSNWFEWLVFAFQCHKFHSNSNPFWMDPICFCSLFQMVRIWIRMQWILLNASNPFRIVRICIQMLWIPFEWFQFGCKCFESLSNGSKFAFECSESLLSGSNLHSNTSNPFRVVWICIWMLRIPFEWFEFGSECFK